MLRKGSLAVLALASAVLAARAETPDGSAPRFAPGQEWTIKSASPTTVKVVIDRLEPWLEKVVVHVSIVDLPIPRGVPGAGGTTVIGHMPFEQSALAASVDRLFATSVSPPPSFEAGYKNWQDAKGGIFTVSVEKAIEFTLQAINRR
jgi:hypothetical protein